jgi:hypothetical protein
MSGGARPPDAAPPVGSGPPLGRHSRAQRRADDGVEANARLTASNAAVLLVVLAAEGFVLWFFAVTVHVLGHLGEVARLGPRDWLRRACRDVRGAGGRQWLIAASLVAGSLLGLAMLSRSVPGWPRRTQGTEASHASSSTASSACRSGARRSAADPRATGSDRPARGSTISR